MRARTDKTPLLLAGLVAGAALLVASQRRAPRRAPRTAPPQDKTHVVIIGAGFGGLNAALHLAQDPAIDLTVIDEHNHHLFQPLLYQVATAALAPSDIASPIRSTMPAHARVRVRMGRVTDIDPAARLVHWQGGTFRYDRLIIATGSTPSYFGRDEWRQHAPGLKTLDDALGLRYRILTAFERARVATDEAERQRLLTFVLIGAGPTGIEMAGSIAELARDVLKESFDRPEDHVSIIVVEASKHILADFPPDLSRAAVDGLKSLGVELRLGTKVTGIEAGHVHLGGQSIAAETIIWTAGNAATPVAKWLGIKAGPGGRVPVGGDLSVDGHPGVYVIGDASMVDVPGGRGLPALAPVAKQQGRYVARAIRRTIRGRAAPRPFAYKDYGSMATIGRGRAIAEFGPVHLKGEAAWATWAIAHIFFLIGFRNRAMVSLQWLYAYVTRERMDRLILGKRDQPATIGAAQPPVANPG